MNKIITIYKALLLWSTAMCTILFLSSIPELIQRGIVAFMIPLLLSIVGIIMCSMLIDKEEFDTLSLNKYLRDLWRV